MELRVIIEHDEKGYYVAEVPALPGCLSQGKTEEEAAANIKEAIEGWIEVMESPKSRLDCRASKRLPLNADKTWLTMDIICTST